METKKFYSLIGLVLVIGILFAACQPAVAPEPAPVAEEPAAPAEPAEEPAEEPAAPAESYTFGLVTKALNNPFWDMMHEGAQAVAEANNVELIYLAPSKPNNLEEQTRLVDDLIARQVDGIVLVPVDTEGIVPAIERANEAGIPVAISNTRAAGGDTITFSAIENYEAMLLVAEYMMDALGGEGKIVILEIVAGAQTGIDRLAGVMDTIAKYPGIELLASQTAEAQRAMALDVMENLLQAHPQIDAVIACNDEMALGAIEALDAAGRLDETLVSGFDANNDALQAIYDGRLLVTLNQNPQAQAGDALQALLDYLAGKPVEERIRTNAALVDASNISDYSHRINQ